MTGLSLDTASIAHPRRSVSSIMLQVMLALLPGIALYALLIDVRLLINLLIAISCALIFETLLVKLRNRAALPVLKDASVTLATILFVLSVPQGLPVWQLVFGVFMLCTVGKHIFGGLGHNPFNPAMVAYAVLIVSFPLTMTQWSSNHGLLDSPSERHAVATLSDSQDWDSVTGATPLDRLDVMQRTAQRPAVNLAIDSTENASNGSSATGTRPSQSVISDIVLTSDWIWLSIAWLLGGLYLLWLRIITWQIPTTILTTLWCLYALSGLISSLPMLPANVALFSGAIMLGAFFIATDPVSAATSNQGKLVYGVGIGLLCFVIREFSAYPEGIAFAVLLMNMCVPLIDHVFTRNSLPNQSKHRSTDDSTPS